MTPDAGELMALADTLSGSLGPFTFLTTVERDLVVSVLRIAASQPDREAVVRAIEALKPFAEFADAWRDIPGVVKTYPDVELWQKPGAVERSGLNVGHLRAAAEAILLLSVQVDGEQKEAHATKPSPSSTSATATETALRAAKRLCDNINEFGHVTDAEIFDATETAIQKALETINVA